MDKKLFGKPEKYYQKYLSTRIEPTMLKPYILDYVSFLVINDNKVMAFYDNANANDFTEVSSGAIINSNNIINSTAFKEAYGYDIQKFKSLNDYEIMKLLKSVKLKSLISSRFNLRLKECNDGGYIESSWAPKLNMRASKSQILSIVNDLQRGYNKQLSKQNQNDKNHKNELEQEM